MRRAEATLNVEVVYAEAGRQFLRKVTLPTGSTLQDAIDRAGIAGLTAADIAGCRIGVFGKLRGRDMFVRDGDRVEIYRPLLIDPKDARRTRSRRKSG
jgi:putative ubiquitin-RnfH superfamily antitoxin RatB of RatAB toxin-antitoxin module